ncbi:MAG: ATPase, T2SS/T4P/T4SS family, partial [Myxococcota bacterium]
MMPQIDGILNIVVHQNATELRMGTDRVPKLLRHGEPKRFMMPGTNEETLRELLGELLSDDVEQQLRAQGHMRFEYKPSDEHTFEVLFKLRFAEQDEEEDEPLEPAEREVVGFDVLFFREASPVQDDDEDDRLGSSPQPQAVGQEMSSPEAPSPVVGGYTPHVGPMVPLHTPLRSEDARVSPALAELLQRAVERGASDLHLCTGEWPTLRIDGRLIPLEHRGELQLETVLEGCLMPSVKARLDMGSSADMSLDVPDVGRFRLNIYRSHRGLAAALRVLPERAPSLESLDLPMRLHDLVEQPHGLIIVTGPTGSGK